MPFDDGKPKHRKGVKLSNDTSTVKKPEPDHSAAFQAKATEVFNKFEEYRNRGWELAATFKKFVDDTILPINKTMISKDIEKETIDKLIILATEMNGDDTQDQGIGGVVLCTMLMRITLLQRDKINTLSHLLSEQGKRIVLLEQETKKSAKD